MGDKRVRAFFKTRPINNMGEKHEEVIQVLEVKVQKKFLWWSWITWKEIDRETVPSGVWQQAAILGSTDWKSKWHGIPGIHWMTRNEMT